MLRIRQINFNYIRRGVKTFSSSLSGSNQQNNENVPRNPVQRTFQQLRKDVKNMMNSPSASATANDGFQTHCDVLVIGGGAVGSSVAYWLKKKAREGLNVVVVEKDNTYTRASTVLSVGGLRQQFSLPENIQMSLFGADFLRESKENLGDVELNFCPHGYLVLASEEGAETLKRNSRIQNEMGARNELLTADRLKAKFPWINTDGIALGCHGLEKEGWFDPWALLMGFKQKAREFGAHYVDGEVQNFQFVKQPDIMVEGETESQRGSYEGVNEVQVKMADGEVRSIKFAICVLAAGAASGEVARMARIGNGPGLLRVPLPVEPRKRFVYVFQTQGMDAPGLNTPMAIEPNGVYFRRDGLGGNYICGRSPTADGEPSCENLEVDHDFFTTDIWPTLAHRVPAFESAKVVSSWAGFYEYNMYDENGIIGPHPYYNNLYIATGFSGHGIQQSPAVGRAISELIIDGQFRTIDLTRLGFDRIIVDKPMFEANIY